MNAKYLFFDYDGTISYKNAPPTKAVVEAIKNAQLAGHKCFLNTGRCPANIPATPGIEFDGIVSSCGMNIKIGENYIYQNCLPNEKWRKHLELASKLGNKIIVEGIEEGVFLYPYVPCTWNCKNAETVDEFYQKYGNLHFNKFSVWSGTTEEVISLAVNDGFRAVRHSEFVYEFVPKEFSKSLGIAKVVEHFGASIADTIAFGDSLNDLEMLQGANLSVVVNGADDYIKSLADYVTKSVEDDGVAYYINKFILEVQ